mgnify:CR=1 FL=1
MFGTLHTNSAVQTIDRIIDIFPGTQKIQIRMMVSESLKGIITQQLIPSIRGDSMVVASEILVGTKSIARLVRDSKTFQIPSVMQMGSNLGMKLMDDSLIELVKKRKIDYREARARAFNKKKFILASKKVH